jgi:hypothetical protein
MTHAPGAASSPLRWLVVGSVIIVASTAALATGWSRWFVASLSGQQVYRRWRRSRARPMVREGRS